MCTKKQLPVFGVRDHVLVSAAGACMASESIGMDMAVEKWVVTIKCFGGGTWRWSDSRDSSDQFTFLFYIDLELY